MALPSAAFVTPVSGAKYHSNLSASGQVSATPVELLGLFCASSSGATCKVWNSASAAGDIIANTFTLIAGSWYPLPFYCGVGCYVTITGTADVTVGYS